MPVLVSFLVRALLIGAGLLFAASLAVASVLLLAIWAARRAWARLTGSAVPPFLFRMDPRAGFEHVYRYRPAQPSRTPRADAVRPQRGAGDVTDVEPH